MKASDGVYMCVCMGGGVGGGNSWQQAVKLTSPQTECNQKKILYWCQASILQTEHHKMPVIPAFQFVQNI